MYPNRSLCEVLEEMRQMYKTRNFAGMLGLIEEAQSMGNRMEAHLNSVAGIKRLRRKRKGLRREIAKLEAKRANLGGPKESNFLDYE